MNGCPVLSLVTATPFVAACLIMLVGRTRPLGGAADRRRSRRAVTLGLSLYLYLAYDPAAGGFQFREQYPLVRALGISVELGADGMSVLMVLLTAIIIFAGVFASWTVRVRDQEFYALLLTLVTGVFGVFVSLDLFVFFLFYEIAVLPMYLLIGIWGSTGEVRPQGVFAWAFRETGVGTKEYAAMKLTLYLLLGSAFILVGLFVLYFAGGVALVLPARALGGDASARAPSAGCSSPSTWASASWRASGRSTPGRPTGTRPRPRRSRCSTPAC